MTLKLYSLLAVIHLASSLTVNIPQTTYEFPRDSPAIIPCNFIPKKSTNPSIIITWSAHPDNTAEAEMNILTYYYYSSNAPQLDVSEAYDQRASIGVDISSGWANLTLKSITAKDSRVFQCDVKIPSDVQGTHTDTTTLVVLVAPSKPICAIQGTAEFYQNISLTCMSVEGTPTPTYKWQRYDVSNNPKDNPPKATDVNGVLSLYNISAETSGYYVCTSSNKVASQSCNLTLSVMPYSMKLGSTAGIIGGVALAVILLIVVICCCYHRRKKNKPEEYTMGSREHVEFGDQDPLKIEKHEERHVEGKADMRDEERSDNRDQKDYETRQGRPDDQHYDSDDRYDDRRSDRYDDRRSDRYDDRRSDRYDDRRSDRYDDRRSDRYDDRYDDRRTDRYDDRRSDRYDDRRPDRYDDRRSDRYDDRRYDDQRSDYDDRRSDRYDGRRDPREHYDDRNDDRGRPPNVPANKPTRS